MTDITTNEPNGLKRAGIASLTVLILASLGTSAYNVQQTAKLREDNSKLKTDLKHKQANNDMENKEIHDILKSIEDVTLQNQKDSTKALKDTARLGEEINNLKK